MTYTVMMLEDAEQDLRNIHSYIKSRFSEPLANEIYQRIRDRILRRCALLGQFCGIPVYALDASSSNAIAQLFGEWELMRSELAQS